MHARLAVHTAPTCVPLRNVLICTWMQTIHGVVLHLMVKVGNHVMTHVYIKVAATSQVKRIREEPECTG